MDRSHCGDHRLSSKRISLRSCERSRPGSSTKQLEPKAPTLNPWKLINPDRPAPAKRGPHLPVEKRRNGTPVANELAIPGDEVLSVQRVNELWQQWCEPGHVEQLVVNYMQKKTSHELPHSNNEPHLQEMIQDSKLTEWNTIRNKGAIRIHVGKKARQIKQQQAHRFIGSRFVIARKPTEENG